MTRMLRIFLFVILLSTPAHAEDSASLFDAFLGEWRSDGEAFGAPAQSRMIWEETLDGKFYRLTYRIEIRPGTDDASVFEGRGFYKRGGGVPFDGFWADNSGDLHPIEAEFDGNALIAHWGVAGGKQGRSRYLLTAPDEIEVTDWIKTNGGLRAFNRNLFSRVEPQ